METEDGWVTGKALETVIALRGIREGDWIRHAPNCVDLSIGEDWIGKADRLAKVAYTNNSWGRRIDFVTADGEWFTGSDHIDAWKPKPSTNS